MCWLYYPVNQVCGKRFTSLLFITCALQLEAFYSIFTTEQQDHVKSVEYLWNNFRPTQELYNRLIFKSAVKDAWLPDPMADGHAISTDTEASRGKGLFE